VNPRNDEYYVCEGVSRDEILERCQISPAEFDQVLQDRYSLNIIEVNKDCYAFFPMIDLYELID